MNKHLYYLIQWTWGLPLNIVGLFAFLYALIRKRRWYKWRKAICIVSPWNFGGLNLGMFIIHGENNSSTLYHEYGHSIQNMQWGILCPFVITLVSATRYWCRKFYNKFIFKRTLKELPEYDSVWFERQATEYGNKAASNAWSWI